MTTQWESLANEHILGIAPYEPGKPVEELERELGIHDAIKLASNENPLPPSDRVQQAIIAQLTHLNRYPDGSGFYLRQAVAKKHGFHPDQVMLGNGSNDLIELVVRAFMRPGDEAVVPHPSFVVYPMIVQAVGGIRVMVMLRDSRLDLEAMARAITPQTKVVFIANPNNPTATIVTADAIALMNRIRQPFNVNALGQAAALAALEDDNHVVECVRMIEAGKAFLYEEFKTLGVKYVPSRANFILVDVGRNAADIYQKLLHEGVIVRPLTPFGMETALRITIGTPDENRKLVKALRTVLGKKPA